ncbi:MAG: MBL fold metallo-hydrolase, partial [Bacteroidota bacterium]
MKQLKKIVTRMLLSIVILIASLVLIYLAFVNFYPSFGGDVNEERQALYNSSQQFSDGKFINTKKEIPEAASFSKMLSIGRKFFFEKVENGRPDKDLKIQKIDAANIANYHDSPRLIWFGHSAFLLQLDGKNILIDPMLGKVPAPHEWMGAKRFNLELPIEIKNLPKIDAVVISHD